MIGSFNQTKQHASDSHHLDAFSNIVQNMSIPQDTTHIRWSIYSVSQKKVPLLFLQ